LKCDDEAFDDLEISENSFTEFQLKKDSGLPKAMPDNSSSSLEKFKEGKEDWGFEVEVPINLTTQSLHRIGSSEFIPRLLISSEDEKSKSEEEKNIEKDNDDDLDGLLIPMDLHQLKLKIPQVSEFSGSDYWILQVDKQDDHEGIHITPNQVEEEDWTDVKIPSNGLKKLNPNLLRSPSSRPIRIAPDDDLSDLNIDDSQELVLRNALETKISDKYPIFMENEEDWNDITLPEEFTLKSLSDSSQLFS